MVAKPNILLLISDTVKANYLTAYGNDWVDTPYLTKLARMSNVFEECHCSSFPTGPMRKDLLTGRYTAFYSIWRDELDPMTDTLPRLLKKSGYHTARIGDTYNVPHDFGFDEEFIIPGQTGKKQCNNEEYIEPPAPLRKLRTPKERIQALLRRERSWESEEDRFAPQTMRRAHAWLESRHKNTQPFFLMVDTFDPHEPWNPPQYYIDRYAQGYQGNVLFEPAYEPADYATKEEIRHMCRLYAGELTMVDRWFGYLLEGLSNMGLWEETLIIFISDHGFYHGEHGLIGKVRLDREGTICGWYPLYRTISHVPLIIKNPGSGQHRRIDGLCQPVDIMPTILEDLNLPIPSSVQGISLSNAISTGITARNEVVSTPSIVMDKEARAPASYRTQDYLYIYGGDEWENELFDLRSDGEEKENVIYKRTETAAVMHERYWQFLKHYGVSEKSLSARKTFPQHQKENTPYKKLL